MTNKSRMILVACILFFQNVAKAETIFTTVFNVFESKKTERLLVLSAADGRIYKTNKTKENAELMKSLIGTIVKLDFQVSGSEAIISSIRPAYSNEVDEKTHDLNHFQYNQLRTFAPTDLQSYEKANQLFQNMLNDGDRSRSQCFKRAHMWSYDMWSKLGVYSQKIFMFYTKRYQILEEFDWWLQRVLPPVALVVGLLTIHPALLFAALGGAIQDPTGSQTSTSVISLANQLAEFMPSEDILGPGGKLVREGTGLQTLFQRIEAMQSDPELQRQFFQGHKSWGGASFEQRSQAPIQSLLTNANSTFSKNLQSAFETIAPDVATVEQINHNLRFAGNQALANIQRRLDTAAEDYDLANTSGAQAGMVREALDRLLPRAAPATVADAADRMGARAAFETAIALGMSPTRAGGMAMESMSPLDAETFRQVQSEFMQIMAEIEVNTRSRSAVPDQTSAQQERK